MYSLSMTDEPKSYQLIATFMTASTPLEQYLQQGRPLTDLEVGSVSITVKNLQLFLDIWKRKHGKKDKV